MKDISYIDKIVKQHRTNLHKIAELSHVEFKTAKYIRDYLDKLNIEYEREDCIFNFNCPFVLCLSGRSGRK